MALDEFGNVIPFFERTRQPTVTPAQTAQNLAMAERSSALNILAQWFNQIMHQRVPFDEPIVQSMVNREAERNAQTAQRLVGTLRQRAAASGLGITGRTIEDELSALETASRRTASAERDIRSRAEIENARFRQAQVALAGQPQQQLAGIHLGTSFQLPDIGFGSVQEGLASPAESALLAAAGGFEVPTYFGDAIQPSGERRRGRTEPLFEVLGR